jgi:hypothetical protein
MNNLELMTWQDFKSQLSQHKDQILQFQYAGDSLVDASYHITEIKQAPIVSVDCGGVMNSWTEIIVQLWEPGEKQTERAMTVSKALSIVDIAEKKLSLNPAAIVKIEFGNSRFDTRQMYPGGFHISGDELIVSLVADFTQCKATGRGGSCGTTVSGEECCAPAEKSKLELKTLNDPDTACCAPGSGCC